MVTPVHVAVRGRSRFRVHGLYRSESLEKHLETVLSARGGVLKVSANALTGNVLVFHRPDQTPEAIAVMIRDVVSGRRQEKGTSEHGRPDRKKRISTAAAKREGNTEGLPAERGKLRRLILTAEAQKTEAWHLKDTAFVLNHFGSRKTLGLSQQACKDHLKKFGPNMLPESVPRSGLGIFMSQFNSLPVVLLGVAAGISLFTGGIADALVIMSVVVVNAVIGYVTESGSERTIHSLKRLVRPTAVVIRDGEMKQVSTDNVVPGDVLVLRPGSYIAADARIIEAQRLTVDESTLTGESLPVEKTLDPLLVDREVPLADRINMVYMGTLVIGGQGLAVAVATGRYTEIGRIQALASEARPPDTPMERQLDRMGEQLVIVSCIICGGVFLVGMLRGYGFLQMLKSSIALAVAAVPEGLPAVATTTLALGLRNMRKQHVLIRHLEAVETLGSIQTICLDKTGTITLNRMSVHEIHVGMKRMTVQDGKFLSPGGYISPYACDELLRLIHVAVLCNESEVVEHGGNHLVNGSPTENALINMALSTGVDVVRLREQNRLLRIFHRSEGQNVMLTTHRTGEKGNGLIFAVKGSPQEVLSLCADYIKDGVQYPLTEEDRQEIELANERMAGHALRVLGFAYARPKKGKMALAGNGLPNSDDYIWLGMAGMADPIREGLTGLISKFHAAGIDTVMITGDQTPTAYAIGKELALSRGEQMEILDSTHLADMDPDVLMALCRRVHVFSRVSPAHKLQIVQSLQRAGRIVAMTGDGINDGPALKVADVGIAMGHTGTDLAREVADVVLEDDNLQTMVIAISQGRTIYNNIRKAIHYLLSTNMSEIMVMFIAIGAGLGQPLNTMQLLWINLVSDIFPGLALALEPPEPDVLNQPPRSPEEQILKTSDFKKLLFQSATLSAGALAAYGYGIVRYGMGPRAGTLAFLSLSSSQLLHAISCRSEKHSIFSKDSLPSNRYLNQALAGSFALQGAALFTPGLRSLLGIGPINVIDGAVIAGTAVLPLMVNELAKEAMKGSPK